ncbi:hypothetical protein OG763_09445 [Streptomyces sp. NBC_01230]|uniref:hypothetical protein n=1 Tax=Streptomyces sp. NBC_01230 TaxID=2903784 RepID=UPI002E150A31|nr:hypothetical protein OG763_09445 [Streptomyces sp. NBC_01230]
MIKATAVLDDEDGCGDRDASTVGAQKIAEGAHRVLAPVSVIERARSVGCVVMKRVVRRDRSLHGTSESRRIEQHKPLSTSWIRPSDRPRPRP